MSVLGEGRLSYCSRCGNLAKEGAQFCDRCGAPLSGGSQSYSQGNQTTYSYTHDRRSEKDPLIAIILSVLIPGLGQMYCGKVGRGMAVLVLLALMSVFSFVPLIFLVDPVGFNFAGFFVLNVVVGIVVFAIYVWQIYDAYRCAESHNRMAPPMRY